MESTLRRGAGAPDLKLIETLGWDGAAFVRLDLHLARLGASAAQFGWNCDLAAVRAALFGAVLSETARVRMTLDAGGVVEVTVASLPEKAAVWRVGLAGARLSSDDPWLGVKSTQRAVYDEARAQLPTGLDEVIFQNERGEVCDGSITSVFFDLGEGLCTPPLSCGLLPGVLRAEMLALGVVQEAVLIARELNRARLWVGNSVRGLIRARFVA
jgi:4-amino-4-deoxychorismate lyase